MISSKDLYEYPPVMTVPEVQKMLRIGRSAAYRLVAKGWKEKTFPVIKVGDTYRVPRDAFICWMEEYSKESWTWGEGVGVRRR